MKSRAAAAVDCVVVDDALDVPELGVADADAAVRTVVGRKLDVMEDNPGNIFEVPDDDNALLRPPVLVVAFKPVVLATTDREDSRVCCCVVSMEGVNFVMNKVIK
jgi:hypothetical protein